MSTDRKQYYRRVYGGLDYIADLGGLLGAVAAVCRVIMGIFNFYGSYQFVMSELFVSSQNE